LNKIEDLLDDEIIGKLKMKKLMDDKDWETKKHQCYTLSPGSPQLTNKLEPRKRNFAYSAKK
jgi:hypothetical protein